MTGWPADQAIGRPCYQVLALEEVEGDDLCGAAGGEAAFPGGQPLVADGVLVRPGGSRVSVSVTYSPLYDEDGRLTNVIANVVDVTRFREAEEMKSTFVSVISHELKTPGRADQRVCEHAGARGCGLGPGHAARGAAGDQRGERPAQRADQ